MSADRNDGTQTRGYLQRTYAPTEDAYGMMLLYGRISMKIEKDTARTILEENRAACVNGSIYHRGASGEPECLLSSLKIAELNPTMDSRDIFGAEFRDGQKIVVIKGEDGETLTVWLPENQDNIKEVESLVLDVTKPSHSPLGEAGEDSGLMEKYERLTTLAIPFRITQNKKIIL